MAAKRLRGIRNNDNGLEESPRGQRAPDRAVSVQSAPKKGRGRKCVTNSSEIVVILTACTNTVRAVSDPSVIQSMRVGIHTVSCYEDFRNGSYFWNLNMLPPAPPTSLEAPFHAQLLRKTQRHPITIAPLIIAFLGIVERHLPQ